MIKLKIAAKILGKLGGLATVKKRGKEYMAEIGKKGGLKKKGE